jgi:hypothetical protein
MKQIARLIIRKVDLLTKLEGCEDISTDTASQVREWSPSIAPRGIQLVECTQFVIGVLSATDHEWFVSRNDHTLVIVRKDYLQACHASPKAFTKIVGLTQSPISSLHIANLLNR